MNMKQTVNGNELCIALEGRLDTTTAPELEKALKAGLDGVKELVFHPPGCACFWERRRA